jgi:hypothetical protein
MRGGAKGLGLLVTAVLVGAFVFAVRPWREEKRPPDAPPAPASKAPQDGAPAAAAPSAAKERPAERPAAPVAETPSTAKESDPLEALGKLGGEGGDPWASIDMEAVRRAMPNNAYWAMGAPTNDPEILRGSSPRRAS